MTKTTKNLVIASMAVAGVVALASVLDLILHIPFNGGMVFDIMFLLGAALVAYMGYDCLKDSK